MEEPSSCSINPKMQNFNQGVEESPFLLNTRGILIIFGCQILFLNLPSEAESGTETREAR